jgi:hypothetical protein
MPLFKYEIQNCISVEIDARTAEDGRMELIENIDEYADSMIADCCISDGTLVR